MAQRLSLKVGYLPDAERPPDSPEAVVVVEPTVGAVARTKGSLYLIVVSRTPGPRMHELTRKLAESIRDDYYYDESAGVKACLERSVIAANKRLWHDRDRLGMAPSDTSGPIGIALAVTRGEELYVGTVGPAEAFLIRGARLSTLPDPDRDQGLPSPNAVPDVWRGELAIGDSLVLATTELARTIGPDGLKDAAVTLHPQPAVEELARRYAAAGGAGTGAVVVIEAGEASTTQAQRTLVPVRAPEPLAGAPDRSPIPLADSVEGGVAAVSASARQARDAAGGFVGRGVRSFQDRLPRRSAVYRRVTPTSVRQESQRRAAVALIALVAVAGSLGLAVWLAGGSGPRESVASLTAGQRALEAAREAIDEVWAPGVDLVDDDPERARELLEGALGDLEEADGAGVASTTIAPLRTRVVAGLDKLFDVIEIRAEDRFTFPADLQPQTDLVALIRGPDGRAFVIDDASGTVYRIDPSEDTAQAILVAGTQAAGTTVGRPRHLAVGGRDLLILDDQNVLWRWRPADDTGKGTVATVKVRESASWGDDVRAIDTFCRNSDCSLYYLYVVDPSEQQILRYTPAADGSSYQGLPDPWLVTDRDVSGITDLYIDGDLFTVDTGTIERYSSGRAGGWDPDDLEDAILRPDPSYRLMASASSRGQGFLYAFDDEHDRVVAFEKGDGAYIEQYRLVARDDGWSDLRGFYVVPGADGAPDSLVWIEAGRLRSAPLVAVGTRPPSPSPSPSPSPEPSPEPSPSP